MAVLSWGKPTVEYCKLENGDLPNNPIWKAMPEIVADTAKLIPEQGEKKEATAEGGDVVDVKRSKNKYSFELEVFVKKGDAKPIEDDDGFISEQYAIRLTPEDETTEGFIFDRTNASCQETWTSADGKRWKYVFDGLKPKTGKILKPYTKQVQTPVPAKS